MSTVPQTDDFALPLSGFRRVDGLCDHFEAALRSGQRPVLDEYLANTPEPERSALQHELLRVERDYHGQHEESAPSVLGDYELLDKLGKGGMGVVYRARQRSLNKIVALKVIRPDRLEECPPEQRQQWLDRFRTEAQIAARLEHDHIVTVYEVGEAAGQHFYAMRYVEGQSLADLSRQGPLPCRRAVAYLEPVARAVHHAHQRGILHRDLKPGNIMVDASDRPFVTDFGLAKWLGAAQDVTQTGDCLGSPSYLSPEQVEDAARVTAASDVYSLGATLYALLTGRPPFQASTATETLHQVKYREPVPPRQLNPEIDRDLETITLKCLHKEPGRRYRTAAALADDLKRYYQGEPIQARPVSRAERLWRWCRRQPALAGLTVAVALSLLAGTGIATYFAVQAGNRARQAQDSADEARVEKVQVRRHLYVAHMNLAQQAWEDAWMGRLHELLDGQQPERTGGLDLRGFEWYYWQRLAQTESLTLDGRIGVAFSPDGKRLATVVGDTTVKVCDAANGQELFTFRGHTESLDSLAFSPDSRYLATTSYDSTVRIWDVVHGGERFTIKSLAGPVHDVSFRPDGQELAFACQDGTVRLWGLARGAETHVLRGHTRTVLGVAYSPDGKRLASAGEDAMVRVWSTASGLILWASKEHSNPVYQVAFSPDGKLLASAGTDHVVRISDAVSGQETHVLRGHTGPIRRLAMHPQRRWLASASDDRTVRVWDLATGRELRTFKGHSREATGVAFSPDGKRLASAGHEQAVKVWDLTGGQEPAALLGTASHALSLALNPNGKQLALSYESGMVTVWNAATGQETRTFQAHAGPIRKIAFHPNGQRLASAGDDGTVRLWDMASYQELQTLKAHSGKVASVVFSPDGGSLASCGDDGTARIWEVASGRETRTLSGHTGAVLSVAFSPDGRQLASAGQDRTVRLWDLATGRETRALDGHGARVFDVIFSPDGQRLASASQDGTVRLWDVASGQETRTLKGHTLAVRNVVFSPDGKRLVSTSWDQTVKIWEATTGQETLTLKGHLGEVIAATFDSSGQRLISLGGDGAVKVWDARPWTEALRQERAALGLYHLLAEELLVKDVMRESIHQDATLSEPVRRQALALVEGYREDVKRLNKASWLVVRRPDLETAAYRLALRQAEAACRLQPDNGSYRNTLGVAQYRAGQYPEALATLTQAERLNAITYQESHPGDLAFLAMTQHRLGHKEQAQATLARLREAMGKPQWAEKEWSQAFLREAEALVLDTTHPDTGTR